MPIELLVCQSWPHSQTNYYIILIYIQFCQGFHKKTKLKKSNLTWASITLGWPPGRPAVCPGRCMRSQSHPCVTLHGCHAGKPWTDKRERPSAAPQGSLVRCYLLVLIVLPTCLPLLYLGHVGSVGVVSMVGVVRRVWGLWGERLGIGHPLRGVTLQGIFRVFADLAQPLILARGFACAHLLREVSRDLFNLLWLPIGQT